MENKPLKKLNVATPVSDKFLYNPHLLLTIILKTKIYTT